MNKLEANVSLLIITFFAAIQYAFLGGVPDSVSHFSFLCITNLLGFLITLALFFSELFRLDKKQVKESFILSAELFGFNIFMLLGTAGVGATVSASVLSGYFVFIAIISFLFFKQVPTWNTIAGIVLVLLGLFFLMNADVGALMNVHILYLIVADIFFSVYIITTGKFTSGSNPSILAMGQMLFNFLFSLLFWAGESIVKKTPMTLPSDPAFWGSVIFIALFIRGIYGVVQIYAQRYVSPLNTSLIFSTEILMTMAMSPILAALFGTEPEVITSIRIVGGVVMVAGVLMADSTVFEAVKKAVKKAVKRRETSGE